MSNKIFSILNKAKLKIIGGEFSIYRLTPTEEIPQIVLQSDFYWIGKTNEELSIVCNSEIVITAAESETDWSIIKVNDKLDFALVGIMAEITNVLSKAGVSIIALSTFDTDYIMLKMEKLETAVDALRGAGYNFTI